VVAIAGEIADRHLRIRNTLLDQPFDIAATMAIASISYPDI